MLTIEQTQRIARDHPAALASMAARLARYAQPLLLAPVVRRSAERRSVARASRPVLCLAGLLP